MYYKSVISLAVLSIFHISGTCTNNSIKSQHNILFPLKKATYVHTHQGITLAIKEITARESTKLLGFDIGSKGVKALWCLIENHTDTTVSFSTDDISMPVLSDNEIMALFHNYQSSTTRAFYITAGVIGIGLTIWFFGGLLVEWPFFLLPLSTLGATAIITMSIPLLVSRAQERQSDDQLHNKYACMVKTHVVMPDMQEECLILIHENTYDNIFTFTLHTNTKEQFKFDILLPRKKQYQLKAFNRHA